MLFALSFALKHGGKSIHVGQSVGLSGGAGTSSQSASASQASAHRQGPNYSQPFALLTSSLPSRFAVVDRNGHTIYINSAATATARQTESWNEFLLRCAIISAIVWLTSLLVRRAGSIAARLAFVAAGLLMVVFTALMQFQFTDPLAHAALPHAEPPSHFQSAAIHLRQGMPATDSATLTADAGSAITNPLHIDSPIRALLADVSNLPPTSIVGGPAWLDTDSYDITARIDPTTFAAMQKMSFWQQRSQVRWMEQELLVDRFHLKLHVENRQSDTHTGAIIKTASASVQPVQVLVIDHIDRPSEN